LRAKEARERLKENAAREAQNCDHEQHPRTVIMAKAYWIATYRAVHDPAALAAYAALGAPALQKAGGRILARGNPAMVYDDGMSERTVLIEFDSVAQAIAAHDSVDYQEALKLLGNSVVRDLRIVEAVS
jgi:uncharacterized protein (DUF1330 family)